MSNNLIGTDPNQVPSNADLGTLAYQDAGDVTVENLKIGTANFGTTPSAWLTVVKDNDNSGNQVVIADAEGTSASIRSYAIPGSSGDPAGLILNHYYAQSGSGNQYMRYADFVANVGSGAGTTMRFITKNSSNTYKAGLQINQDGKLSVGNHIDFDSGTNQRLTFNDNRALEGNADGSILQVGEGYTKILNQGYMVNKATTSNRYNFEVSTSFTATGSSVTRHEINLNTLIGASTAGTLGYTVHVVGYGSGGTNGLNYTYTVGGYSGHNYSGTNHSSMGAGTIQNGYNSSNNTSYDAQGISYHPCKNLGAYIANGEVYAYVPGPQRYGVTISNNSASFGCVMTIRGMYTG
tara:strand:- start:69 stop:1118 length:1050 start_codon:yes stop_codon:yes gene_type:complete